jgi:hypothetical protein
VTKALVLLWRLTGRLRPYQQCIHPSHRLNLPCWRYAVYDGFCAEHNQTCYGRH